MLTVAREVLCTARLAASTARDHRQ